MGSKVSRLGFTAAALFSLHAPFAVGQVNVTTYHNDNARTGQNTQETILTPANVNSVNFGKLYTTAVDGDVYAQPLYLSNIAIAGATHNVVYVATQHDSVYAIDADTGTIYWQKSLLPAGGSTVNSNTDLSCGDIGTEVGITGTPVIDATSGTLYVVAKTKLAGRISQQLHALDVGNGAEKFDGPNTIAATVAGKATDGNGSIVTFNPRMENQRPALLLENGHVVIGWTSHCDRVPWHGWIMSYGATTLTLEGTYNASANGYGNGIWMSGGGIAADAAGNIYFATGNGSWSATDQGNSVVKLGPPSGAALPVLDYFTPYNQGNLTGNDTDLSAGGVILLPSLANGQSLAVIMGKEGKIYLLDQTNLGKYCIVATPACAGSNPQIVQEIAGQLTGLWGTPAYWNGNLYWGGGNDNTGVAEPIKAYSFNAGGSGKISTAATSVTAKNFHFSGPVPSISSNGNTNGILWGIDNSHVRTTCAANTNCQALYAYDATDLTKLLYTSVQAAGNRDLLGQAIKFVTPTIANGKVYVPSSGSVSAFGELTAIVAASTAPTLTPGTGTYTATQSVTMADTTPNAMIYYTTDGSTPTTASTQYTAAIAVTNTATVNAFAVATGYSSSTVTTAAYTITAAPTPPGNSSTSLTAASKVYGIVNDGVAPPNGGFDNHGDALSSTLVGSAVSASGVRFTIGSAGAANGVSKATITLPAGTYTTLNLLAAAVNGNQVGQVFVVTYTDGTTTSITQSLSDWYTPRNYAGETKALSMPYVLSSTGALRAGNYNLYSYAFAIDATRTVKSLTLPVNRNVVVLSVTMTAAATGSSGVTSQATSTVSLAAVANVFGLFNNRSSSTNGGFDTHGYAISKTLVGASQVWSGATFTLGAAATADAASAVIIPLTAGAFSRLKLLATAVNGAQTAQTFVVTYSDGTSATVTQSVSDWFTPKNYAGESVAMAMTYVLTSTGAQHAGAYYVYGYTFALDPTKTLQSLTLPANRKVIVLAADLM